MNDLELKNLFRRVAHKPVEVPEVDSLLDLARLPHAEDAASPLHADLLRLSRDLEPVSAQLGTALAAAFGASGAVVTHRRAVPRRAVAVRRGWRIVAGAMAASLVVAVALVATHRGHAPASASSAQTQTVPDRIFAGLDERNVAAGKPAHGDQIFRANFLPDEIFNSSKKNEG